MILPHVNFVPSFTNFPSSCGGIKRSIKEAYSEKNTLLSVEGI
jgi:hypothetical protein